MVPDLPEGTVWWRPTGCTLNERKAVRVACVRCLGVQGATPPAGLGGQGWETLLQGGSATLAPKEQMAVPPERVPPVDPYQHRLLYT